MDSAQRQRPSGLYCATALVVVVLSFGTLIGTGCSKNDKGASQVAVALADGAIKVDPATVQHGKADFNVNNASTKAHSLVVLKTDTPPEQLAVDNSGHVTNNGKVGKVDSFSGPNVTKKLTVDLKPGHYVLVSDVGGDYQQGMRAAFTVQ